MNPYTLLVIARTQSLAKRLQSALDMEHFVIRWVPSAVQALALDSEPSLLVFDPPPSGGARSVARLKRAFDSPLLALSRPDQDIPAQADDSLVRTCPVEQLVERIETMLVDHAPHRVQAGGMSLDTRTRRLQVNGAVHQLRPTGSRIMAQLMARPGDVVCRNELFQRVWRTDDGDSTRALDVHVAHLRRQLEANPRKPKLILTERGVGYCLQPPD